MFTLSNEFTTIEKAIETINRDGVVYKKGGEGTIGYYNISKLKCKLFCT